MALCAFLKARRLLLFLEDSIPHKNNFGCIFEQQSPKDGLATLKKGNGFWGDLITYTPSIYFNPGDKLRRQRCEFEI
jgi:hypothetical protein